MPASYAALTESEHAAARYIYEYLSGYDSSASGIIIDLDSLHNRFPSLKYVLPEMRTHFEQLCIKGLLTSDSPSTAQLAVRDVTEILNNTHSITPFVRSNIMRIMRCIPLDGYAQLENAAADSAAVEIKDALRSFDRWERTLGISKAYEAVLRMQKGCADSFAHKLLEAPHWYPLKRTGSEGEVDGFRYTPVEIRNLVPDRDLPGALFVLTPDKTSALSIQRFRQVLEQFQSVNIDIIALVFLLTPAGETLALSAGGLKWAATFTPQDILQISLHAESAVQFCTHILRQIDISIISPYTGDNPARGSMFFGRDEIIKRILAHPNQNFAVYGGRRSGKTSLLLKLEEFITAKAAKLGGEGGVTVAYVDATDVHSDSELAKLLAIKLRLPGVTDLETLGEVLRQRNKRADILIDEIDDLIDSQPDFRAFNMLRALSNEGIVRVVVAGFATLFRYTNIITVKAFNFLEPIGLFELDENAAMRLVTVPMKSLGIDYKEPTLPKQLLDRLSRYPVLLQYACAEITKMLGSEGTRTILLRHIESAYRSDTVAKFVDKVIFANLTPLARLILLCNLLKSGFTERGALEAVQVHLPEVTLADLEGDLRSLELLGIIRRGEGKRFVFVYSELPALIQLHHDVGLHIQQLANSCRKLMAEK